MPTEVYDEVLSDQEETEEPPVELEHTPITPDLYGATLVSTIIALRNDTHIGELVVAWLRHVVNLFIQVFITYVVWKYILRDKMVTFYPARLKTLVYTARLEQVLSFGSSEPDSALSDLNALNATDASIISLCDALPHSNFLLIVWFLWSAKIIMELSATYGFAIQVWEVPVKDRMRIEDGKDGGVIVIALNNALKFFFLAVLVLPKFFIAIILWWVGIEFLALATDMSSLILKVFTLQFVLTLDELMYDTFIATCNKNKIKASKINDIKVHYTSWVIEASKVLVCIAMMLVANYSFTHIQELRNLCWRCTRDCDTHCSEAFDYCTSLEHARPGLLGQSGLLG